MHQVTSATPAWFMMFVAICVVALVLRLGTSSKWGFGLLVWTLMIVGVGLLATIRVVRTHGAPIVRVTKTVEISSSHAPIAVVPEPPRVPSPPVLPRVKMASTAPAVTEAEQPPMPPVAVELDVPASVTTVTTTSVVNSVAPKAAPVAPWTIFRGSSPNGEAVTSPPEWTHLPESTKSDLSGPLILHSDRFATVEEAEHQLWSKARQFAAIDLRQRIPDAVGWTPDPAVLQSNGFVLERCIELTTLKVGDFEEPMYRVSWKASLSDAVREAVVDAWRPAVQTERVSLVASVLLGATGLFTLLNLVLRGVASRLTASRKPAV